MTPFPYTTYPLFFLMLVIPFCAFAQLEVFPNKTTAYYEAGEEMEFLLASEEADEIEWFITYAEYADTIARGVIENHEPGEFSKVVFTLEEPGFVLFVADQDGDTEITGAAFSPNDIQPSMAAPADFDQFWEEQKALIAAIPLDPEIVFEEETDYATSYRISLGNIDDRRIYGFLSVPKGEGPFAGALNLPSFGSGANVVDVDNFTPERAGMITLAITIHNAPPGTEDPLAYEPNETTDREGLYYRYAILGAIRCIDYLFSRDDFDGENICVFGTSQGGGLSLLLSGIDDRVTLLLQSIAAICAHSEFNFGKAIGFPYYLNLSNVTNGTAAHLAAVTEATAYYDGVYAAARFQGPSYNFISYLDQVCPPATGYAAFNQLPGPKIMVHSTADGHDNPSEFSNARYEFFRRHIESTRTPPWPFTDDNLGYFIDAGANTSIPANEILPLAGFYERDGITNPDWEIQWSVESDEAFVTIESPNSIATNVTFTESGTYKLRLLVTDPYPEDDGIFYQLIDYLEVVVIEPTSTEALNPATFPLSLYPNPSATNTQLTFELEQSAAYTIQVFDASGKKIFSDAGHGKKVKKQLFTAPWAAGQYFVEVTALGMKSSVTMVVERGGR